MTIHGEQCEWNTERDEPAFDDDAGNCKRSAELSIGSGRNSYHVCKSCFELPGFKAMRLRRVRMIERSG